MYTVGCGKPSGTPEDSFLLFALNFFLLVRFVYDVHFSVFNLL